MFPILRELILYFFPKMPDYEIAILFRESWSLGAGKVTIENFFTVLSERGHMIKMLNLPLLNGFPEYSELSNKMIINDPSDLH